MPTYNYNLPDGRVLSFNQEATPEQLRQAMGIAGSVGELRRREGAGEISAEATPVAPTFGEFGQRIGKIVSGQGLTPEEASRTPDLSQSQVQSAVKDTALDMASLTAGVVAPELLPARLLAGAGSGLIRQLSRVGLDSLVGSTAYQAVHETPDVISGEKAATDATLDSLLPIAVGTALGPVGYGAARLAGASTKGFLAGTKGGFKEGIKAGLADLFRNVELSQSQLNALRSRKAIQTATGVDIPIGLSDTIGLNPSTYRQIQTAGNELTEEQLKPLAAQALHIAANTSRSGRTTDEIAKQVFDVLDPQRTGINEQVRSSVMKFAKDAVDAVNATESSIGGAARRFFPSGRSEMQVMGDLKGLAKETFDADKVVFNKAYGEARKLPVYSQVAVDLSPVENAAAQGGLTLVKDASGAYSPLSGQSRSAANAGQSLSKTASLDEARNLASQLGDAVFDMGRFPGTDKLIKQNMFKAAKDAIDAAIAPHPELQNALSSANKLFSENVDRFQGPFAEGILNRVGKEGGTLPEHIVTSLTGTGGESNYNQLLRLLGEGGTTGVSNVSQGKNLIREAIMSTAARSGRKGGGVNVGQMFSVVENIPESVRNQLFPNFSKLRNLMLKEVALGRAGQSTKNAETFLNQLEVDPSDLQAAFSAGDLSALESSAKKAVGAQAQAANKLASLGLDELATRDTFDLHKFVTDPGNVAKTRNLVTRLEKSNPEALSDVRTLFMDDLLTQATDGEVLNPQKLRDLIRSPVASASSRGMGPGTTGQASGRYSEVADALLGSKERNQLMQIADNLGDVNTVKDIELAASKGWFNKLIFGYQGGNVLQGTKNSVVNFIGRLTSEAKDIRYWVASKILTDPQLRGLALEPLENLTVRHLNRAIRLASQSIREAYGKDSDMYRQIQAVDESLPDTSP